MRKKKKAKMKEVATLISAIGTLLIGIASIIEAVN